MQVRYAGRTNVVAYDGGGGGNHVAGGAGGSSSSASVPGGNAGGGSWASAGLPVSAGGILGLPPSLPSRDGFSEEDGPPLIAGFHTGYRWWAFPAPDLSCSPADADEWWDPDFRNRLTGMRGTWEPGVNTAVCLGREGPYATGPEHDPETIPDGACSCGYWAYWELQHRRVGSAGDVPVCGVIKGSGRTRRGPLGFRCAKARILAVTLPDPVVPVIGEQPGSEWRTAFPDVREAGDGGRVVVAGKTGYDLDGPEIRAALSHAAAWTAVIGDRIGQMYPGVRVFESVNAMRTVFPPDENYSPPGFRCPRCGQVSGSPGDTVFCGHCTRTMRGL